LRWDPLPLPQTLTDFVAGLCTIAFMLEMRDIIHPTCFALSLPALQTNYTQCWQDLRKHFNRPQV